MNKLPQLRRRHAASKKFLTHGDVSRRMSSSSLTTIEALLCGALAAYLLAALVFLLFGA